MGGVQIDKKKKHINKLSLLNELKNVITTQKFEAKSSPTVKRLYSFDILNFESYKNNES